MKSVLLITYVDFWKKGSGHRTRIHSLVNYLKDKTRLTVFFAGTKKEIDTTSLSTSFPGVLFEFATGESQLTFKKYKDKFKEFIKNKFFDLAIVEYIELSAALEYLPENTVTLLDTHDIVFDRVKSFEEFNVEYDGIVLNKKEELNIYKCYDYIILIQKRDYENIAQEMDSARLLLVPHPANLRKKVIRRQARNVGLVASQYSPNVEGLKWFIQQVWDKIYQKYDLQLNVYGDINHCFPYAAAMVQNKIFFHGFVNDLDSVYDDLDIVVNPTRCGGGLKIKNIEALGCGLPLITTSHGASGIEEGASLAFFVADSCSEYLSAFKALTGNYNLRRQVSESAFRFAQLNFSEETCYNNLFDIIN